jgi:hypothetical protein
MINFYDSCPFKPAPLKLEDIFDLSIFVLVFPEYSFRSGDDGMSNSRRRCYSILATHF